MITLHVQRYAPDEAFYVIRADLLQTGTDASGRPARVVVWQAPAVSGLTTYGSERDFVTSGITRAAARALRECRK